MSKPNLHEALHAALDDIGSVLLGKRQQIRLALSCLLAKGHLLIEDLPGMGKTTLSHALAQTLALSYNRIQFTADLLPSDILGASIFDKTSGSFQFHPGPLFTQVLLGDEINRASPKAQSALLEGMEERQVTLEGKTYPLPLPFFVIATQNPMEQAGTFPLPESQLDRFLMRIELGYPNPQAERELLSGVDRRTLVAKMTARLSASDLQQLQASVDQIKVSEPLLDYLQRIIQYTRTLADVSYGLSPRGGLALLKASRAWALIDGRHFVQPDDVQAVLPSVVTHRLGQRAASDRALAERILSEVRVL